MNSEYFKLFLNKRDIKTIIDLLFPKNLVSCIIKNMLSLILNVLQKIKMCYQKLCRKTTNIVKYSKSAS